MSAGHPFYSPVIRQRKTQLNVVQYMCSKSLSAEDNRILYVFLTHKWCLTEQFTASHKVADGDVKVSVPTAPVRDFGEGVCR